MAETANFLRDAEAARLSATSRVSLKTTLAANPEAGDLVVGSGGIRKLRVAGRGKGKSGGFRVLTAYIGPEAPVYLLSLLSKGDRETFTAGEVRQFAQMTAAIRAYWQARRPGKAT